MLTQIRYTEGKRGTRFRGKKDLYSQKLKRIMSNIGSHTSSTFVTITTTTLVLEYYYASKIVLEESMMQVSFGLTTEP